MALFERPPKKRYQGILSHFVRQNPLINLFPGERSSPVILTTVT